MDISTLIGTSSNTAKVKPTTSRRGLNASMVVPQREEYGTDVLVSTAVPLLYCQPALDARSFVTTLCW